MNSEKSWTYANDASRRALTCLETCRALHQRSLLLRAECALPAAQPLLEPAATSCEFSAQKTPASVQPPDVGRQSIPADGDRQ